MHTSIVKKIFLFPTLLMVASMACAVQLTAATPTEIPATSLVVTVAPTQESAAVTSVPTAAVPTQVPAVTTSATAISTPVVPTQLPPTPQPTVSAGTTVTYRPLTLVIPPAVARGASGSDFSREDGNDAAEWQKTPGHLQVMLGDYYVLRGKTNQPQIYVYPAQAYVELVPGAFESIHRLDNILYGPGGPSLGADQLPAIPFFNARQVFTSSALLISFQNGSGVRFLTEYAQYPASANNQDLFYTFQGVTRDGAYYIVAIFPVSSPVLAETSEAGAPLPSRGIPYPYMANPQANMNAYYASITDLLNTQRPDSFTPSLNQLDALIQSMQINP